MNIVDPSIAFASPSRAAFAQSTALSPPRINLNLTALLPAPVEPTRHVQPKRLFPTSSASCLTDFKFNREEIMAQLPMPLNGMNEPLAWFAVLIYWGIVLVDLCFHDLCTSKPLSITLNCRHVVFPWVLLNCWMIRFGLRPLCPAKFKSSKLLSVTVWSPE